MKFIIIITALSVTLISFCVNAVEISNVFHGVMDNDEIEIRFHLSETADASINIYDDRDYLIRRVAKNAMSSGDNSLMWDLKDNMQVSVPAEAYKYVVIATGADGVDAVHDLSDITGGKSLIVENTKINKVTGDVEFILQKPARVHIRAGLSGGGPLLVTVANWLARGSGHNSVKWNGFDSSNEINIQKHKKLYFNVQAYSFSDNTIVLGENSNTVKFIDTSTWEVKKREVVVSKKKRMVAANQQTPETRGDFVVNLDVPDQYKKKNHVPIVDGIVPIKLSVNEENMETIINRRAEPVFYIDGKFSYENEVGFYPMVWQLDTRQLNDGEHYLTVNLRGYEGNFGIASKKIIVKHTKKN